MPLRKLIVTTAAALACLVLSIAPGAAEKISSAPEEMKALAHQTTKNSVIEFISEHKLLCASVALFTFAFCFHFVFNKTNDKSRTSTNQTGNKVGGDQAGRDINKS